MFRYNRNGNRNMSTRGTISFNNRRLNPGHTSVTFERLALAKSLEDKKVFQARTALKKPDFNAVSRMREIKKLDDTLKQIGILNKIKNQKQKMNQQTASQNVSRNP